MNSYNCGDFSICLEPTGYRGGGEFALRRGGEIVDTGRTLRSMKTVAKSLGATGVWIRERVSISIVKESPALEPGRENTPAGLPSSPNVAATTLERSGAQQTQRADATGTSLPQDAGEGHDTGEPTMPGAIARESADTASAEAKCTAGDDGSQQVTPVASAPRGTLLQCLLRHDDGSYFVDHTDAGPRFGTRDQAKVYLGTNDEVREAIVADMRQHWAMGSCDLEWVIPVVGASSDEWLVSHAFRVRAGSASWAYVATQAEAEEQARQLGATEIELSPRRALGGKPHAADEPTADERYERSLGRVPSAGEVAAAEDAT